MISIITSPNAWVCGFVSLFVCLFVNKITQKILTDFDEIFRICLKR